MDTNKIEGRHQSERHLTLGHLAVQVESILAAKSELCERQEETLMQQVEGTLQATGSPPLANGGDGGGDRDRAFLDSPIDIDALTEAQTSRFHAVMALIAEIDSAVSELNDQDAAAEAAAAAASRSDVANTPKPPGSSLVIEDLYDDSPEGKLDREAWDPPDELIRVLKAALATIAEQQVQLQSLAADRKRCVQMPVGAFQRFKSSHLLNYGSEVF